MNKCALAKKQAERDILEDLHSEGRHYINVSVRTLKKFHIHRVELCIEF